MTFDPAPTVYRDCFWTAPDGLKLHARDYRPAAGPERMAVVCLHGLTRNAKDFALLAPRIAATGRRVIVPDVRGRGLSARDHNLGNYNQLVYAQDVVSMMEHLAVREAVFIGTSMGGLITMTLSTFRPDMIAAAVLNDVGPELGSQGLRRILGYIGVDPHAANWDEAADYGRRSAQAFFPRYTGADWLDLARRTFVEHLGRLRPDYDLKIADLVRMTDPDNPPDLWPVFALFAAGRPSLLVHGELSDLLTPDSVRRMREAEFQMDYVLAKDVGHPPSLSEPEVATALDRFLHKVG